MSIDRPYAARIDAYGITPTDKQDAIRTSAVHFCIQFQQIHKSGYSINVAQWLMQRPNLHYVYRSGGNSQDTDVVVGGLNASVKF